MFQIVASYMNRSVLTEISLDNYINMMKNPDFIRKSQVDLAREYGKDHPKYGKIKDGMPCILFNFSYDGYVKNETILKSTGYLYIDFDYCDKFDFSKYPFIVAGWYSLSEEGIGILVKCSGLTPSNIKESVFEIGSILGMTPDSGAVSKDRCNAIGYDTNIYHNPNHTEYSFNSVEHTFEFDNSLLDLSILNKKEKGIKEIQYTKLNNRLQPSDTFLGERLRFSNFSEEASKLDFKDEEFIDLKDNELQYAEIVIPKEIKSGQRNSIMFSIISNVYGLNSWAKKQTIVNLALSVNRDKFHPPLKEDEIHSIINNVVEKRDPVIICNKKKRIVFNPLFNFSGEERRRKAASYLGKLKGIENTDVIKNCIDNWDFQKMGKITQVKITEITKLSLPTIKRRTKEIKEVIKKLNIENVGK